MEDHGLGGWGSGGRHVHTIPPRGICLQGIVFRRLVLVASYPL
jgi:hypothetical protein